MRRSAFLVFVVLVLLCSEANAAKQRANERYRAVITHGTRSPGVAADAYSSGYVIERSSRGGISRPDSHFATPVEAELGFPAEVPEATRFEPRPCDLVAYAENWTGYDISSDFVFGTGCEPAEDNPNNRNRRRPRGPDLSALIAAAVDRATSLAPNPQLRIAPARIGLTGLETYVWANDSLAPIVATASAGGVTVTAEARVAQYKFDFGDGYDSISYGPGRPWSRANTGSVGHTYEIKGYYDITADAIWTGRWRINSGPWQPLGYFSTSDSRRYPVQEIVTRLVETG